MAEQTNPTTIPMQVIQGCLVVSVQIELTEELLSRFQEDLLERIRCTHVKGVVLDVSGVEIMDSFDFAMLRSTMTMASIMGTKPMLVGLKPGIVSALIDMDVDVSRIQTALNVDDAIRILRAKAASAKSTVQRSSHKSGK